jgi:L-fuculose-phosphate aldolase
MANPWKLKQEMCEVGRRIYDRGLVSAFEGNLSARLGPDRLLCTPSGLCKALLKPEDLCMVDMDGKQVDGHTSAFGSAPQRKRSSEILLHVAIYRERPDVQAVVHTHAPHATAFAITHTAVPSCISAEVEVYLGEVPLAPYATPGTSAVGESVAPLIRNSNVVLLANHGTVSCGKSLEEALHFTEILEAYCRLLLLARPLGPVQRLSDEQMRDLMAAKRKLGLPDRRAALEKFENCDLSSNNVFGRGYCQQQFEPQAQGSLTNAGAATADRARPTHPDIEALVLEITERVWSAFNP